MCQSTSGNYKSTMSKSNSSADIPALLEIWLHLGRATPKFDIGGLDFGFTLASCLALAVTKYSTVYALVNFFGWPAGEMKSVDRAAACLVPILHSASLVPSLGACFWTHAYSPSAKLDVAPAWWQEAVHYLLGFCTGYMIYDTIFSLLLPNNFQITDDDFMFFVHHVMTVFYMTSTRVVGAGHQSAMICMFLGEMSNPFHNFYYFLQESLKLSCCNGPLAQSAMYVTVFLFASSYAILRTFIGPAMTMFHASYDLLKNGRENIPLVLIIVYVALIWAVSLGSYPWIVDSWKMLHPYFFIEDTAAEL